MAIHSDVDREWRRCSFYKLKDYLSLQLKGFRECLNATCEAIHIEQTENDMVLLKNFVRQCFYVFDKYARVCIKFESNFKHPEKESSHTEVELYLKAIQKIFVKVCTYLNGYVDRRKIYILIRILCKSRLTMEKYLVHLNFWEVTGNL